MENLTKDEKELLSCEIYNLWHKSYKNYLFEICDYWESIAQKLELNCYEQIIKDKDEKSKKNTKTQNPQQ